MLERGSVGRRPRWRHALPGLLAAVLVAAGMLATAPPAHAHDRLLSSTPEDGAHLDTAPAAIALTFSAEVMEIGAAVAVLDSSSQPVAEGDAVIDGADVTQPLAADLPDGGYAVRWRVVSSDGHPISGSFTFTVGDPSATPPPLAAPPQDGAADDAAGLAAETGSEAPDGWWPSPRVLLLAALGAGAGVAVYLVASTLAARRSRARPPTP
ncbi:copper resistance CopC family protein [Marinitenerispora sediminis]|uniref:copper resistance CopC family protein n=1 Tax=Marinitenerispora sediminis TaxID=1931232 RepID=UPI001314A00A|nr:copper resistance protein CopC [Marinitenerispora sediminis]